MSGTFAGLALSDVDDLPDDHGRWLIHGPQGSGKTRLASTIAECGKTLFLDFTGEKGVRSFKGAPYAKDIEVIRPPSITDFDDVFWALNKGEHDYKAVIVDSLTAVQKMTMRFLLKHDETAVREIRQGTAPADIRTWGQSLDVMVSLGVYHMANARPTPDEMIDASSAPDPPSRCPCSAFVELTRRAGRSSPQTAASASRSTGSPMRVAVPCALQ